MLGKRLERVCRGIQAAYAAGAPGVRAGRLPQLIAVSKTRSVAEIQAVYALGQRHFGENYVQELVTKAVQLPADIEWHFIGHLQRNKAGALARLAVTEGRGVVCHTVDSERVAQALDRAVARAQTRPDTGPGAAEAAPKARPARLRVLLQLNTSGEATKSGCAPEAVTDLAAAVAAGCPRLQVCGLMTIGAPPGAATRPDQSEFDLLRQTARDLAEAGVLPGDPWLSMGMSADYEAAVRAGATHVRVGSAVFGPRA